MGLFWKGFFRWMGLFWEGFGEIFSNRNGWVLDCSAMGWVGMIIFWNDLFHFVIDSSLFHLAKFTFLYVLPCGGSMFRTFLPICLPQLAVITPLTLTQFICNKSPRPPPRPPAMRVMLKVTLWGWSFWRWVLVAYSFVVSALKGSR